MPLSFVDPFIGTGGFGFGAGSHNPCAQLPHGSMRLGPDTGKLTLPFDHYGGYHYSDDFVRGFSHTHLVGAGVGDYGNFGVLPARLSSSDPSEKDIEKLCLKPLHRALPLDHSAERAGPGWYALNVSSSTRVRVRLAAAGSHAGVHEYGFEEDTATKPSTAAATTCAVLVDACHTALADVGLWEKGRQWCKNASISVRRDESGGVRVLSTVLMHGDLTGRGPGGSVHVHLAAVVDEPSASLWKLWASGRVLTARAPRAPSSAYRPPSQQHTLAEWSNASSANASLGALLRVPCASTTTRVAISFISEAQAEANLEAQAPLGTTFSGARGSAEAVWKQALSAVRIVDDAGASTSLLRSFSTAVYRTRLAPSIFDETGSSYLGMDGAVRRLGEAAGDHRTHAYTDMSLWDIHRTQLPWLSLTAPAVYEDVVRSLQAMGSEGGDVPRWPLANAYTNCMVGNHAIPVVAEAIAKGHGDAFNASELYELFRRHATEERPHASRAGVAAWVAHGFVPVELEEHSASLTLSYAFDDASLASIARHVGRAAEAETFDARAATGVQAGWSPEHELMCPRSLKSGKLHCPLLPFVPYPGSPHYVEGDAWQWLWFVPHDPSALVKLFASPQRFVSKLDEFMTRARAWPTTTIPNPYYWAGNEPDLLAPWLFAFAGAHGKTASTTRWVAEHKYSDMPDGLPGNDDFGTLSSWLVWAQLGLYPLAGSDRFVLGAPRFGEVAINLGGRGRGELRILAHNASSEHTQVLRAEINGSPLPLEAPFVRFADLVRASGALLEVWMA
jgi:putative alpha-1,2-mannosidase